MKNSLSPREALERYADELHENYEKWYEGSKTRVGVCWQLLQIAAYFAGFAAALLAALKPGQEYTAWKITLPLIGSFASSLIVQFRLRELTEAREQGRISFQLLTELARQRLASARTEEECAAIHKELAERAHDIESAQSSRFFTLFCPPESGKPDQPKAVK